MSACSVCTNHLLKFRQFGFFTDGIYHLDTQTYLLSDRGKLSEARRTWNFTSDYMNSRHILNTYILSTAEYYT